MERQKQQKKWDKKQLTLKMNIAVEDLCKNLPSQFADYFNYLQMNLKFGERPDYSEMVSKFEGIAKEMNIQFDEKFDWVVHKQNLIDKRDAREAELKKLD